MRVVIGEDEALLRHGLVLLLEAEGITVAATTMDADELFRVAVSEQPDVVVTDIRMPPPLRRRRPAHCAAASRPATPDAGHGPLAARTA